MLSLGSRDVVTFRGYLSRTQLSIELMHADLCVHPALTESLSKAWLDAMAHGVPLLTSQVGAARDGGRVARRAWLDGAAGQSSRDGGRHTTRCRKGA